MSSDKKNKGEGHRERLRDKFMSSGLSGFHDYSRGLLISDVVATLGSVDIVLGEVDR